MRAFLVFFLLFFAGPALAAPPWAGVPLDGLSPLGVERPTLSVVSDGWRAPLAGGGVVDLAIHADEQAAGAAFAMQAAAASSRTLGPVSVQRADEAAGLDGFVVARSRNVVIVVRADDATAVASRVLGALVVEAPAGPLVVEPRGDGEIRWDAVGRRVD